MKKNIGKLIQERVKSQRLGVTEFAKLINKERSNVYDIYKRDSIDTDLLKLIGQVLDYDFFQDLLEPETINKIIIKNSISNKILVEVELPESEFKQINITERIIKVITKKE